MNRVFTLVISLICIILVSGSLNYAQQWMWKSVAQGIQGFGFDQSNWDIGYINNDEYPDFVILDGDSLFWYANSDWAPRNFIDTVTVEYPWMYLLDMDNDDDSDILMYNRANGNIFWYRNDNSGMHWIRFNIINTQNFVTFMFSSHGDLDQDGDIDLVIPTYPPSLIRWLENLEGDTIWTPHTIATNIDVSYCTVADVVGDSKLDVVAGEWASSGQIIVYENQLPNTTWQQHPVATLPGAGWVECADMTGDGNLDIVTSIFATGEMVYFENPSWNIETILSGVPWIVYANTGDIDRDQDMDLSYSTSTTRQFGWIENDNLNWILNPFDTVNFVAGRTELIDMDGDYDLDIATAKWSIGPGIAELGYYINPLNITVTYPNGGESWGVGDTVDIEWTSVYVADIKIELSMDNGITWPTTIVDSTPSPGMFTWIVSSQYESQDCVIKISSVADSNVYDKSSSFIITSVESLFGEGIPKEYKLTQNYPNPFNPNTTIKFALPEPDFVTLSVYNILGEEVSVLVSEELNAGIYKYNWNAINLPSGIYLYRLNAGSYIETMKMVLMK